MLKVKNVFSKTKIEFLTYTLHLISTVQNNKNTLLRLLSLLLPKVEYNNSNCIQNGSM